MILRRQRDLWYIEMKDGASWMKGDLERQMDASKGKGPWWTLTMTWWGPGKELRGSRLRWEKMPGLQPWREGTTGRFSLSVNAFSTEAPAPPSHAHWGHLYTNGQTKQNATICKHWAHLGAVSLVTFLLTVRSVNKWIIYGALTSLLSFPQESDLCPQPCRNSILHSSVLPVVCLPLTPVIFPISHPPWRKVKTLRSEEIERAFQVETWL